MAIFGRELMKAILKYSIEFGETSREIAETLKDGPRVARGVKAVHKEAMEDIEALMGLLSALKERVK